MVVQSKVSFIFVTKGKVVIYPGANVISSDKEAQVLEHIKDHIEAGNFLIKQSDEKDGKAEIKDGMSDLEKQLATIDAMSAKNAKAAIKEIADFNLLKFIFENSVKADNISAAKSRIDFLKPAE